MKNVFKKIMCVGCVGACAGSFALGGVITASATLKEDGWTTLQDRTPECALILEEAKIKNMTDFGYYNVEGQDVWYFASDGKQANNPEIRFVTEGTQTVDKPYTLVSQTVSKFSFDYKIENSGEKDVVDLPGRSYIVQILCEDGSYPISAPNVKADGKWHTIEITQNTVVENSFIPAATQYRDIDELFCGFLFKMGGLDGELMIANITLYNQYNTEIEPLNPFVGEASSAEEESSEEEDKDSTVESSSKGSSTASSQKESSSTSSAKDSSVTSSSSANSSSAAVLGFGCVSSISGAYALTALAATGVVIGIRRRKK